LIERHGASGPTGRQIRLRTKKHDNILRPMQRWPNARGERNALILIDVQNDFISGSMAVRGAERIVEPINRLVEAFENVIVVQDWHPLGHISFASAHPGARLRDLVDAGYGKQRVFADHCIQGTPGAELHPGLRVSKARLVLRKGYRKEVDSHSAFCENDGQTATGLADYLRAHDVKRIFCAGLTRYGCVMMSAVDGARAGFRVTIIDDATEDDIADKTVVAAAEQTLADRGVARVATESVVSEGWLTNAGR
jgi:nicotinamidase/pyrazinamidase